MARCIDQLKIGDGGWAMDQVCFTPAAIVVITGLLTAMAAAMRILYRQQLEGQKDINRLQAETIKDLRARMDRMLAVGENQTQVTGALVETTRQILP